MRKFALSLVVLSLIALPAIAGKYNKVISIGDKAPNSAAFRPSRMGQTPACRSPTSRKTLSCWSSWATTAPSSRCMKTA